MAWFSFRKNIWLFVIWYQLGRLDCECWLSILDGEGVWFVIITAVGASLLWLLLMLRYFATGTIWGRRHLVSNIWSLKFQLNDNSYPETKIFATVEDYFSSFQDFYFCKKFFNNMNIIFHFQVKGGPGSQDFKNWHIFWIFHFWSFIFYLILRGVLQGKIHFKHFLIPLWSFIIMFRL